MAQVRKSIGGEAKKQSPHSLEALSVAEVRAESEALFKSIGDGAIATDEFGHITRINPTALNILGLKANEALGKWFPRVVPIVNADGTPISLIDRPIVKMFLTGQAITEKLHYRGKTGRIVPVSITVSPIILAERPVGAIEVFRDITLENEVDRMKSEFISLASHQLRTPLSTIKTYSHMLIDGYMGEINAEQRRALRTITSATDNMNELIATLLNIARIESGSIAINTKRLNACLMVEDVVKQLKVSADNKGISLMIRSPKRPIILKTDSLIAKEILTNLISNSIKYTPKHGLISISISHKQGEVLFTVTDTGIGIPKQSHDQIFAKFFRAHNVIRQETTGTGLGLYVVKGLVGTLGGKIWFKSEEGRGSTFYISLPIGGIETTQNQRTDM